MLENTKNIILIGYSGHAFVVADVLFSNGYNILGYMDGEEKERNPYGLKYLGYENAEHSRGLLLKNSFVVAIGDNTIRQKVTENILSGGSTKPASAIHNKAIIAKSASVSTMVMIMAGAIINPFAEIGLGTIINTGAIIEHECTIGNYSHIAPGAVLAGNVKVGNNTFIGANVVVKQGITIGNNVIVGAGTVLISNVKDGAVIAGNPGRVIKQDN